MSNRAGRLVFVVGTRLDDMGVRRPVAQLVP